MGPFAISLGIMRVFAVLLLMLAIVATGDGRLAPALSAPTAVESSAPGAAKPDARVLPRFCLGKNGIPASGAILCQAEKRSPEASAIVPAPLEAGKRWAWPASIFGMGAEPGPDLDPPRNIS